MKSEKGRKRIPDHIKALKGSLNSTRVNPAQPEYEASRLQCPDHFNQEQKETWLDIVPQLVRAGVAKDIDQMALEVLCEKWSEYREAQRKIAEHGFLVRTPNGYPQVSPYYSVAKQALNDFGKMMTEFGMTPASRSKVSTDSGGIKNDRFSGI